MTISIGDIVKLDHPDLSPDNPVGIVLRVDVEGINDVEVFFFDTLEKELICLDGRGDGQSTLIKINQ